MERSEFYFDYWTDVIEEDALNEKSCIQVLRILIPKADMEIEELEGDMVVLETQLEWAEQNKYEEWYDLCSEGLREKIHSLELSICSLKNENVPNKPDNGVQSQMQQEPLKKIHEIIKAVLENGRQDKDEQPAEIIVKDFVLDASIHVNMQTDDKPHLINVDSRAIKAEQVKETNVTPEDKNIRLNSPLKTERMRPNQAEIVNVQVAGVTAANPVTLNPSLMLQGQSETDIAQSEQWEVQEPLIAATDKTLGLNSSSELQGSGSKHIIKSDKVTVQEPSVAVTYNAISANSSLNSKRRGAKMPKNKIRSGLMGVQNPGVDSPRYNIFSSNSPSNLKIRGKRKADKVEVQKSTFIFTNNYNSLSSSSNKNRANKIVQPVTPTYSHTSLDSVFKSQEDRKNSSTIQLDAVEVKEPIVASDKLLKLPRDATEIKTEGDLELSKPCDVDYSHKYSELSTLKVVDLRFLAKSRKIKGHSKMSKAKLIEELLK